MTIDLVKIDPEKIKISYYPDGQVDVTLLEREYPRFDPITIQSRINDMEDFGVVICTIQSLKYAKYCTNIKLYVPYMHGGRADRQFEDGQANFLKDVVGFLLNNLGLSEVRVIDPHSGEMVKCIKNLVSMPIAPLVASMLIDLDIYENCEYALIAPDKGAVGRVSGVAEVLNYPEEVIFATKTRVHEQGVMETNIDLPILPADYALIIVDDICDGGGTFILLSQAIKKHANYRGQKIYLYVTHGIFSKGVGVLREHFDTIFTTNSYKTLAVEDTDFVLQYNVFTEE